MNLDDFHDSAQFDASSFDVWLNPLIERGWGSAFAAALDALEPFGVLGAQMAYIAQPALHLFGWGGVVGALAHALETPEGFNAMRTAVRTKLESCEDTLIHG